MQKEQIGLATMYCGDCREILPAIEADVMITDPVWPNCPADLLQGADDPTKLMRETMQALLLNDVPKLMQQLGISFPEMLATPKAVQQAKTEEDAAGALQDLFARMGRAGQGNGPVRHRTIDVTPEKKEIE